MLLCIARYHPYGHVCDTLTMHSIQFLNTNSAFSIIGVSASSDHQVGRYTIEESIEKGLVSAITVNPNNARALSTAITLLTSLRKEAHRIISFSLFGKVGI